MAKTNNELKAAIFSRFSSQRNLADALGWQEIRLSNIIRGRVKPTLLERRQLADKLRVHWHDIFPDMVHHRRRPSNDEVVLAENKMLREIFNLSGQHSHRMMELKEKLGEIESRLATLDEQVTTRMAALEQRLLAFEQALGGPP